MEIRNIAQATALVALAAGCATTTSVPTDRIAAAEAAVRSAENIQQTAPATPEVDHHLNLAHEQLRAGHRELKRRHPRRSEMMFIRARTDAELAQSLALSAKAENEKRDMASELEKVKAAQPQAQTQTQTQSTTTITKKVEVQKKQPQATGTESTPPIPEESEEQAELREETGPDEHAEHLERDIDE